MTSKIKSEFIKIMIERGFIHQTTDQNELDNQCHNRSMTGYIGFDCTASSLHVGSLIQIMMLRWFQKTGHKPIVLMGGGTTKIGDPSGKDSARPVLTNQIIHDNKNSIKNIFENFLYFGENKNDASIVDNASWLENINYIEFLRDFGSLFSVNKLLNLDSIKMRLEREQNLSFLEFNYSLLQAFDFLKLNEEYDCKLQMGGSDQWGNIISGIDLIRRMNSKKAFGITSPLITNNDGSKMGKTVNGAIWLDERKLSNYDFYQFWRNIDDANISRFLNLFTKLPISEIKKLSKLKGKEINEAKKILAFEVTKISRGESQAKQAEEISNNLFDNNKLDDRIASYSVKSIEILESKFSIIDAVEKLKLVKSRSEIKRLIKSKGIKVNNENYNIDSLSLSSFVNSNEIKIAVGKKKIGVIKII